ncbi:uncharacterized protein HMPREF1541_04153 [Cyphellophora europaea CBS 101466]|uniref:Folliculin-interacting protein N-terminal domain-containing protein n=1 Tax=Cyphellophora europaea (strain CBS 101466) TaxID=1220924 RepID=W2S0K4_CYPE1|nr:uncharacterized protein HMPREF1541_04153 [Cyphellophora europaea CBS 101466]ETN42212.1 hypothetical protein HMPREF1541_04153 [Cyphellophora europaea CBS 101466]
MLGRLIQGYGKGPSNLESTTEEAHSRSLLWPSHIVDYNRGLPSSPPSTPISSSAVRIGPFDDRGGIEINQSRDFRVIIAQDAFGTLDKQLVLFDSHKTSPDPSGGRVSTGPKSIPRDNAKVRIQPQQPAAHQRNRSSTIAGPPSAWSRPNREPEADDKVNRLLECMFGNTSTTKSDSSTKMHILYSGRDSRSTEAPNSMATSARPPFVKALTSSQPAANGRGLRTVGQEAVSNEDVILITRLFAVPLPDSQEPVPSRSKSGDQGNLITSPTSEDGSAVKRTKLIEKKTPMYAVALLVTLPPEEARLPFSRPPSRMSMASSSYPNSFGSDFASSWTLLEAISDSLASSTRSSKQFDRRIDALTSVWDVILRGLSDVEAVAKTEIRTLLQLVNRELMSSMVKIPKGPNEQRTNQRNIYLSQSFALAHVAALHRSSKHVVQRISLALRIPKAVTGTGFVDGHWIDEARYLVQICGSKTQNYFFFNLLTAFLGNHTEWLEGSGFRWAFKAKKAENEVDSDRDSCSRTVIVADHRSLARRLVFLLASFLPTSSGLSPFEQQAQQFKSPLATPGLPSSSPLKHIKYADPRASDLSRHGHHVSFGITDTTNLSTSASSTGSVGHASARRNRPQLERKDSDAVSVRTASRFPTVNSSTHLRKTSAANSAMTPDPVTSLPYFSAAADSYFPENAVVDGSESVASDQLAKILRRDSSNTLPPRSSSGSWGFLGLWSKRPTPTGSTEGRMTADSNHADNPANVGPRREPSKLESMVGEAASVAIPARPKYPEQVQDPGSLPKDLPNIGTPRLKVDEEDGVVDVDIGIPGFLGWEVEDGPTSPPIRHHSLSGKSYDGATSIRSSFSHSTTLGGMARGEETSVAGYLKQYHEDFRLQAVRPYPDLMSEIKESMLRESDTTLSKKQESVSIEDSESGAWSVVSSTLVVDVRKFTVERLVLHRKRRFDDKSDPVTPVTPSGQASPATNHRFTVDTIGDFDPTLAEAIEGLLDMSRKVSHLRSTSGVTASGVATPPASFGRELDTRPRALRSNCRHAVADALEQVVRSVSEGLDNHENGRTIGPPVGSSNTSSSKSVTGTNMLREGVKNWLLKVETRRLSTSHAWRNNKDDRECISME